MWGQGVMYQTFRHLFLIALMVLFTVQLLGTACSDDCLPEWSNGPLQAQDQTAGEADGQTETDSQGESESEFTLARTAGPQLVYRMRSLFFDSCSCPRKPFDSDFFRPPALFSL